MVPTRPTGNSILSLFGQPVQQQAEPFIDQVPFVGVIQSDDLAGQNRMNDAVSANPQPKKPAQLAA
jgi:hypothetical protein